MHDSNLQQILTMVVALSAVISAFILIVFIYRKMRNMPSRTKKLIEVLACSPVNNKDKVLLLEANGIKMLLGVSSGGINTLHVFQGVAAETESSFVDTLDHIQKMADSI